MAYLKKYTYERLVFETLNSGLTCKTNPLAVKIDNVPCLVWSHNDIWQEASVYLADLAFRNQSQSRSLESVDSDAWHLRDYASWLEAEELSWSHFPEDDYLKPTYRYRGNLIKRRKKRELAGSTASNRIRVIKRFYEWVLGKKLIEGNPKAYKSKNIQIIHYDTYGLRRALSKESSDLSIPYLKATTAGPENGLFPIKLNHRDTFLKEINKTVTPEFLLHLKIGFFSGMRIGTILSLTESALQKAFDSSDIPSWKSIEVGPRAGIATKNDVTYHPSLPVPLIYEILHYSKSLRRLSRKIKANKEDKELIFLTNSGKKFSNNSNRGQLSMAKRHIKRTGLNLDTFKFHSTRATFGTSIVLFLMANGKTEEQIIPRLMALLGHTRSESSWRYVKFVEENESDIALTEQWTDFWVEHNEITDAEE